MSQMGRIDFKLDVGGRAKANAALYNHLYGERIRIFGATATIIPLVDPHFRTAAATSTVHDGASGSNSGLGVTVFTATEPPEDFVTPFNPQTSVQGIIPYVALDGTDEAFRSPNLAYFNRDDSGATPVTYVFWINVDASAAVKTLMAKYDENEAIQQWSVDIDADEKVQYLTRDDNIPLETTRISDAAISTGQWHQIVVTYDGSGGDNNQNGTLIYVDGVVVASTADNSGTYVAMEDGTSVVSVGARTNAAAEVTPFVGKMACGPLGPTVVNAVLAAAAIAEDWRLGRAAMAL